MDITTIDVITQLVSTVGFPILISGYLLWYNNKQSEMHKQEIDKLAQALQNNTDVMIKICERLGLDDE